MCRPCRPCRAHPPKAPVTAPASALALDGIPATALTAYQTAARRELLLDPACGLTWPLLAGIGRVESDHGRFAGAVLHADGESTPRIIGIPLDGHGTARILDTDNARLDGDAVYDRAVGPMQFIPSTWVGYGTDGNRDHVADPFNIFDAAAAAGHYLCATGGTLSTLVGQTRAIRAYNDSDAYIALVLQLEGVYAQGVPGLTVPILPPGSPLPGERSTMPPANPGPPLGALTEPTSRNPPVPRTSASPISRSPSPTPTPIPSATSCTTPTASSAPSTSPSGTPTPSATTTITVPIASPSLDSPTPTSTATPPLTSPATPTQPAATC